MSILRLLWCYKPVLKEYHVPFFLSKDPAAVGTTEVHNFFASCVQVEQEPSDDLEDTTLKDVMKYLSEPLKTPTDLLTFWKDRASAGDALAPLAKKLLAIPATSTPSERSFSVAGRLIEERRTALDPECVDQLLFLHSNVP